MSTPCLHCRRTLPVRALWCPTCGELVSPRRGATWPAVVAIVGGFACVCLAAAAVWLVVRR